MWSIFSFSFILCIGDLMIDKSINDIFDIYNTSSNGLDENEALIRLNKYGYNKLNTQKELNHFLVFLKQLIDPLVYVLLAAFILSILLKEYSDAIIIIFVVLVNSIISSIQEIKANKAVKSLNKLTVLEKRLDLQMQEYQNRLKMVDAELQSCQGAVDNSIQRSFSYQL